MDEEMVERLVGELAATRRHFDVAVEGLRVEVREGLTEVREDIGGVQKGLTEVREDVAGVQKGLAEVREDVAGVQKGLAEVREDVGGVQKGLAEVREDMEEGLRHSDVIAEGLRSEIRLVAEGVAAMSAGQEQLRAEIKEDLTELRSMIRFSYAELDRRLQTVEGALATLEERVQKLESVA